MRRIHKILTIFTPFTPFIMYAYSTDEETYYGDFPTRREAIAHVKKITKQNCGHTFYTGMKVKMSAISFFDAETIIETAQENAGVECGECSEGWLSNLKKDTVEELDSLILKWIKKHKLEPQFFSIDDTNEHNLTI